MNVFQRLWGDKFLLILIALFLGVVIAGILVGQLLPPESDLQVET
jgi:hypothetical protein